MSYLHELGVMSSVDHHTMHPLSVPELGPPQQDLVWSQWYGAVVRTISELRFLFKPLQQERKADKVSVCMALNDCPLMTVMANTL